MKADGPGLDQARALTDLVQYQPEAIVSRVLAKRATGSITLFAFDAGQELSEHTTPFDAVVSVFDGEAEINVAGTSHRVRAGEAIFMPANVPHALRAISRFRMMLTMIHA
jgi:quercetin dioxygenase-like cupin family protein